MPKLHYWCENSGDGDVNVQFEISQDEAKKAEKAIIEESGEGWGSGDSVDSVNLKVVDGN